MSSEYQFWKACNRDDTALYYPLGLDASQEDSLVFVKRLQLVISDRVLGAEATNDGKHDRLFGLIAGEYSRLEFSRTDGRFDDVRDQRLSPDV